MFNELRRCGLGERGIDRELLRSNEVSDDVPSSTSGLACSPLGRTGRARPTGRGPDGAQEPASVSAPQKQGKGTRDLIFQNWVFSTLANRDAACHQEAPRLGLVPGVIPVQQLPANTLPAPDPVSTPRPPSASSAVLLPCSIDDDHEHDKSARPRFLVPRSAGAPRLLARLRPRLRSYSRPGLHPGACSLGGEEEDSRGGAQEEEEGAYHFVDVSGISRGAAGVRRRRRTIRHRSARILVFARAGVRP